MTMARAAGARQRIEFPYGRGFFLQRFALFGGVVALLLVLLLFLTQTPAAWLVGIGVLLFAYLAVWGLSPLLTAHALSRALLTLRQGWYFRAFVPLKGIESVEPFDGDAPLGLRASLMRRRLYVTGSKVGLVSIRLKEPRRFWAVLGATAEEIVFDVDARDAFLEALRERRVSLPPVQAKRPDAQLRN